MNSVTRYQVSRLALGHSVHLLTGTVTAWLSETNLESQISFSVRGPELG